jgi:Cu-Zn family superoxide dismutase
MLLMMIVRAQAAAALMAVLALPALAVGETAVAEIKGRDGKELGQIKVVESTAGVLIMVKLSGLKPGPHGLHLHETGKCEGDFSSAGRIYNPLGARHGFLNEEGPMAGDLPNIIASATGEVEAELLSPFVTLSKDAEESLLDADGTAFVVFENADDYKTDPEGNAGARIACGVVVMSK